MHRDDPARAAAAVILGVIGAIAITKTGIDPRDGILRWLIFSLAAGVIMNTQEGRTLKFLSVGSALAALSLVGTIGFLALLKGGTVPSLSGVPIDVVARPVFAGVLFGILWVGSTAAVLTCSISRPVTLHLLRNALSVKIARAKRIERLLRIFVAIAGTAALLVYSVL